MAVWIYAYGKNGLVAENTAGIVNYLDILNNILLDELKVLDSIAEARHPAYSIREHYNHNRKGIESRFRSMSTEEYKAHLDSIKLPYTDIDNIVDRFISDEEKREEEKKQGFTFAYEQFKHAKEKSQWKSTDQISFTNNLNYFAPHDGLRIVLLNDLVWITGPFSVFSIYSSFQKKLSAESRDYYHDYFKKILTAFKSDFVLYAHEWSGLDDEEDPGFNFVKLKEQANWNETSSNSIHTMDRFYYERL